MVIAIFDLYKKVLFMPGDIYNAFKNHLGPPELLLGPFKPPFEPSFLPSCGNGVFITNKVTFQIQKCNGYM